MDAREILRTWLEEHGCDGMVCAECSCCLDDLVPCGKAHKECVAARAVKYGGSDV